ncbi:eukaryotic translation elongation factor 1 delta a (guanine nucleotide exchange protein) isoform X7 [Sebastes umbrosus]|uniref:eukaryotic translation elongation factor 1 delta a (guanine nucleotide exchange protein) isoform X7 n=1 Tax=Sebastes umbrosus TaxID=72105 RepID=UPI0018A0137C|nr:eukaryotic translation elongation factor 1 delta a (guanine nucleotide exchange protein) isoform X7 [Sebastes umbrosus]
MKYLAKNGSYQYEAGPLIRVLFSLDYSRGSTLTGRLPSHKTSNKTKTSHSSYQSTKMSGLQCLASENIWFDKQRYDEAEKCFYEGANGPSSQSSSYAGDQELVTRMKSMELENHTLHTVVEEMRAALQKLESRVAQLEKSPAGVPCAKAAPVHAAQVKVENGDDDDDDDDMDLFGSDDDDEEAERLKQERIDAYAAKKSKKPTLIAKSSILLDVKPWDDETDMKKLEECVRSVQMDGLLWGASKLLPVGYGIKKLQINCVVEDDKVGTDILEEEITKFEDYIQSVDVAAFNKI